MMHTPRDITSLLSLNKEGVFSCVGFLCLYVMGRCVGTVVLSAGTKQPSLRVAPSTGHDAESVGSLFVRLCGAAIVLFVAFAGASRVLDPPSRRLVAWLRTHLHAS